jgi:tetraacyldisaccharide 4'-kinase
VREPAFWHRPPDWRSALLTPLASLYGFVAARRMARPGHRAGAPVICVGNYHTGGAGKTPTVLALAKILKDLGETPFALTRGYGGTERGPLAVDVARHAARDVGDEPLLLARALPVIVSGDRAAGADLALRRGASVILMDDGFQNPSLRKDLCLIVIDGRRGVGNGKVFPAGPLRAPLAPQLARTDALIAVGDGDAADPIVRDVLARSGAVFRARIAPAPEAATRLRGRRVLAFAGIGDPERFAVTLRGCGADVVAFSAFPDHYSYSADDIATLRARATREGLQLVTTQKDMVRMAGEHPSLLADIAVLPIVMAIEEDVRLAQLLRDAIARRRAAL